MMSAVETELQMVERHVREGERHLTSQREIIARLRARGRDTSEADRLLTNLEDLQRLHLEHLRPLQH